MKLTEIGSGFIDLTETTPEEAAQLANSIAEALREKHPGMRMSFPSAGVMAKGPGEIQAGDIPREGRTGLFCVQEPNLSAYSICGWLCAMDPGTYYLSVQGTPDVIGHVTRKIHGTYGQMHAPGGL